MEYLEINGTVNVNLDYPCAVSALASELSALKFVDDNGFILITLRGSTLGVEGEGLINSSFLICSIAERLEAYLENQSTIDIYRDTDLQTLNVSFIPDNQSAIDGKQTNH